MAPANRVAFTGMGFFDYDPAWRLEVALEPREGRTVEGWQPVGRVAVAGAELTVFRLTTYGGGLFLPFRDATNGRETYGGGRYLLDTVKGADLGTTPSGALSSTSTTPITRAAPTTRCGRAPFHRLRTRSRMLSGLERYCRTWNVENWVTGRHLGGA